MQDYLKVEDAADFFIANRKDKFHGWRKEDIIASISKAIDDKVFAWSRDSNGQLTGITIGVRQEGTIHIAAIIINPPATLWQFIKLFRANYKGFRLTGLRGDKLVDYRRIYGRSRST